MTSWELFNRADGQWIMRGALVDIRAQIKTLTELAEQFGFAFDPDIRRHILRRVA